MAGGRRRHPGPILAIAVVLTIALVANTRWTSHHPQPVAASGPRAQAPTAPARDAPSTTSPSRPVPSSSHAKAPSPKAPSPAQVRAAAVAQIARLTKSLPSGSYSIAAVNMSTGASYSAGSTSGMWTASVYKLFLLEILMQREGGPLTGGEAAEAVPMIENSDNVAGYQEFIDAGNRAGMESGLADLGLKHTVVGESDPTFTVTSATDCLTLLKNLVEPGRLSASARSYALNLMEQVEADQRWGVGVDADRDTDFANKNGWLSIDNDNAPGEDDDDLWAVNSVGVIRVDGQQVLMAVLTQHRPDFDSGVQLVQALARAMKPLISS